MPLASPSPVPGQPSASPPAGGRRAVGPRWVSVPVGAAARWQAGEVAVTAFPGAHRLESAHSIHDIPESGGGRTKPGAGLTRTEKDRLLQDGRP